MLHCGKAMTKLVLLVIEGSSINGPTKIVACLTHTKRFAACAKIEPFLYVKQRDAMSPNAGNLAATFLRVHSGVF